MKTADGDYTTNRLYYSIWYNSIESASNKLTYLIVKGKEELDSYQRQVK